MKTLNRNDNNRSGAKPLPPYGKAFAEPCEIIWSKHARATFFQNLSTIRRNTWRRPLPTTEQIVRINAVLVNPAFRTTDHVAPLADATTPHTVDRILYDLLLAAVAIENLYRTPIDLTEIPPKILHHLGQPFLTNLAAPDPFYHVVATVMLNSAIALAIRVNRVFAKRLHIACDLIAHDREAICYGPDAMRDYVARGGSFSAEPDASGFTDAHAAARVCSENPLSLATFLDLGGPFHDHPDRLGRTPTHYLINSECPEAVLAFTSAGGRLYLTPDDHGRTALTIAAEIGPDMIAAVRQALEAQHP